MTAFQAISSLIDTMRAAIAPRYQGPTLAELYSAREDLIARRREAVRRHRSVSAIDAALQEITVEILRMEGTL